MAQDPRRNRKKRKQRKRRASMQSRFWQPRRRQAQLRTTILSLVDFQIRQLLDSNPRSTLGYEIDELRIDNDTAYISVSGVKPINHIKIDFVIEDNSDQIQTHREEWEEVLF